MGRRTERDQNAIRRLDELAMTSDRKVFALLSDAGRMFASNRLTQASEAARKVLALRPKNTDALTLLGAAEGLQGRHDVAIDCFSKVVAQLPASADAHFNLGRAFQLTDNATSAEQHYAKAVRLSPLTLSYRNNLALLHASQDRPDLARRELVQALELNPNHEQTIESLYFVYRILGAANEIETLTRRAIAQWPDHATHRLHRAEALFALGHIAEAWQNYSWRFQDTRRPVIRRYRGQIPEWRGEDLTSKSVLVWTEQGPGDEIMYATLIADLRKCVGRLSILSSPRIAPLLRRSFPDIDVFADSVPDATASVISFQAPLLAFAEALRPSLESFHAKGGYLVAEQPKVIALRDRYRKKPKDILIGIAWRSANVEGAHEKTVPLAVWGPIFALPGVRFVNLQYGNCQREFDLVEKEYGVRVINDETIDPIVDLDQYAAQVAAMDYVISSSNTAAHFAGALGIPTYCMLPTTVGRGRRWYWLEVEGKCAWYESLTYVGQVEPKNWLSVIRDVAVSLATKIFDPAVEINTQAYFLKLSQAYRSSGQAEFAEAVLRRFACIPGQIAIAFVELARTAKQENRLDDAMRFLDIAIQSDASCYQAINARGMILLVRGDPISAESSYREAIKVKPDFGEAYNNLGTAVRRQGRGIEANNYYLRAKGLLPKNIDVLQNVATNLMEINQQELALRYFEELIELSPNSAKALQGKAHALLSSGRFLEGWPLLWWRHGVQANDWRPSEQLLPRWSGQELSGASVLVWTEHGLGDEILTASIFPDLIDVAKHVTIVCTTRLVSLFARSFPRARIIDQSGIGALALSQFNFQFSLSELGVAFRNSIEDFPRQRTLLTVDRAQSENRRLKYQAFVGQKLIGISWSSANPEVGTLKSMRLSEFVLALEHTTANLVNLQYGDCGAEIDALNSATGLKILRDSTLDSMDDIDGFAAQVAAMDLVVTVSNTTAHIAGAMGVPTLLLLPYNRGRLWYWIRSIAQCLWYPSVQYLLQGEDGSWDKAWEQCRDYVEKLNS